VKARAGSELAPAVDAVLRGRRFVSGGVVDRHSMREEVSANIYFHFEFDPESKIVQGKFHGPVTSESIKEYYRVATSLVANADFLGSITDFSGATRFDVTADTIRELAALAPADPVASRPRVIVAPNALIFGLARIFRGIGKATRPNLHIVRNLDEALDLLGIATPHFQSIK
jgi:hypothetical protein